jgi:hypothetical protein
VAHAETFNVACNAAALTSVITTVNTNGEEDFVWLAPSCVYPLAASWIVQADGGNPVRVYGRATRIGGQDARTPIIVEAGATLHLSTVTVRDGATTGRGGAIHNAGTLILTGSTVTESTAQEYGGGIYNTGTARLTRSTVSSNVANIQGGGIDNNGAGSRLTLVDSTVTGNASSYGGGIRNAGSAAVFNSTFFGNSGFVGGGILIDAGAALLTNVTLSDNTVTGSNGGGGIRNEAALRLDNSIVANHLPGQADCSNFGTITPLTSNLIEDGSCAVLFAFGGDPKLGSPTGTPKAFPLSTGSPAIDAGQNPACTGADQRGTTRPRDGNGDGYAICDLGAFEVAPKGACGLLGIEAFGVLPLARLLARARSRRRARGGDATGA